MKYKEWLENWLVNYVEPTSKGRTLKRYSEIVKLHISHSLGEYELTALTPIAVQLYITELLRVGNLRNQTGLAPNSVNSIIGVIQRSLKTAHSVGLMPEYFGDRIIRPKVTEKKIDSFSLSEQKKIEEAVRADGRSKMCGILICLYSGLRIGELLALEWSDFSFSEGTVAINRAVYDGKDEMGRMCRIVDTPKTESSKRVIPIPRQLIPYLREKRKKSSSPYVISNRKGAPISVRSYQRSFELMLKKLGIKEKGFHSLRHTFATRALECGMDVKTLSEILGHKNPNITLSRYVHSMLEHKKSMMNKIGKLFG